MPHVRQLPAGNVDDERPGPAGIAPLGQVDLQYERPVAAGCEGIRPRSEAVVSQVGAIKFGIGSIRARTEERRGESQ